MAVNKNVYRFYVYGNGVRYYDTLDEAVQDLKTLDNKGQYSALGIEKNNIFSCDILMKENSYSISQDYTKMDNFKNDEFTAFVIEELQDFNKNHIYF